MSIAMSIAMPVPMPSMVHSLHGIQKERGKGKTKEEGEGDKKADIETRGARVVWAKKWSELKFPRTRRKRDPCRGKRKIEGNRARRLVGWAQPTTRVSTDVKYR
jgi:hypothetical protein